MPDRRCKDRFGVWAAGLGLLIPCGVIRAQVPPAPCGVDVGPEDVAAFLQNLADGKYDLPKGGPFVFDIPLTIHVVRNDAGQQTDIEMDEDRVDLTILATNSLFDDMQFCRFGPIRYIDDTGFQDVDGDVHIAQLRQVDAIPDTINVYFVDTVSTDNTPNVCGVGSFTWNDTQGIIVDTGCTWPDNPSLLAHELGHYFDLWHTHEPGKALECVGGGNCEESGDKFCDTPADPKLNIQGVTVTDPPDCEVQTELVGPCKNDGVYAPDGRNIMSYSLSYCRTDFSPSQEDHMFATLLNLRPELFLMGCEWEGQCGDAGDDCYDAHPTGGCEDVDCCITVCAIDSFCCNLEWDAVCAAWAFDVCSCLEDAGDCSSANPTPGCEDCDCTAAVCQLAPSCCNTQWDAGCAAIAGSVCVPNDDCAQAIEIFEGDTPFSTINATTDGLPDENCDFFLYDQIDADIWYTYTAPCQGILTLSTCGQANFDTKIALYYGTVCWEGVAGLVQCNDDAQGCPGFTSRISGFVTAGDYLIRLGGYQGQQGTGTLTVDLEPDHDQCADAQNVFGDAERLFCTGGADTDGPAHGVCINLGDPQVNSDVWFNYQASCTGVARFSTCNTADYDVKMAVYEGCDCPVTGDRLLDCDDDEVGCGTTTFLEIPVMEGDCYKLRIGGYLGNQGTGTVSFTCTQVISCDSDLDGDGITGITDFLMLLAGWGQCAPPCLDCPGDLDGDCDVGIVDFLTLLGEWGPCGG